MTVVNLDARREAIKSLIASAGSTIFAVTFFKKDGSKRVMQVQLPAIKKVLVGDAASEGAKAGVAKRKANFPNLCPVFDIANQGVRSIDLDTVVAVNLRGFQTEWSLPATA
jgi:hypothetical protein